VEDRLAEIGWTLHVAGCEIDGLPYTAPEVFVGRLRELLPQAHWLIDRLAHANAVLAAVRQLRSEWDERDTDEPNFELWRDLGTVLASADPPR
jgi:hypothetical protein